MATDAEAIAALERLTERAIASRQRTGTIASVSGRHAMVVVDGEGTGAVRAYRGQFEPIIGARVTIERAPQHKTWKIIGVALDAIPSQDTLPFDFERLGTSMYYPVALEAINDGVYNLSVSGLEITLYNVQWVGDDGAFHWIESETLDLTASVPVINSRWVVIRAESATDTLDVVDGATTATPDGEWVDAVNSAVATGYVPVLAIRLDASMVQWSNSHKVIGRGFSQDKYIIRVPYRHNLPTGGGGGVTDFTDLGDVPSAYTGHANKTVTVKSDESGLEFTTPTPAAFTLDGDSGTPQTITSGDTLTVAGTAGIVTSVEATDTITIGLDDTGATSGDVPVWNGTGITWTTPTSVGGAIDIDDDVTAVTPANTLKFPAGTVDDEGSGVARYNPYGYATTADYDPTAVGNCYLWFKSNTGVTKGTTQLVSQWNDQSGSARNLTQATAARQPWYCHNMLNGYPAICFDGTDDFMTTTGVYPQTGAGTRTCIVVGAGAYLKGAAVNCQIFDWGTTTGSQSYGLSYPTRYGGGAGEVRAAFGSYYYVQDREANTPPAEYRPFIVIMDYDGAVNHLWHNGILCQNHTIPLNTGSVVSFKVGQGLAGDPTSCNVLLCELIIFNDLLTQAEREAAFTELGTKYNIPVSF